MPFACMHRKYSIPYTVGLFMKEYKRQQKMRRSLGYVVAGCAVAPRVRRSSNTVVWRRPAEWQAGVRIPTQHPNLDNL
jgi:hypothetical protein